MSEQNNMVVIRTAEVIAEEINEIKTETFRFLHAATKHATVQSFEIGKRLIEAKELVPGGSWLEWLRDSVDYSEDTAQNLMRIAREYDPNSQAIQSLSYSQLVALFALPPAEREDFAKATNASELPVKDIKALIKEKERLKSELSVANKAVKEGLQFRDKYNEMIPQLDEARDLLDKEKATVKKLTAENKTLAADLKKAKNVTPKTQAVDKTVVEKVYEPSPEQISSLRSEVEKELRERLAKEIDKNVAKQDPVLIELNIRFEQLQRILIDLSAALERLDETKRMQFSSLITKTITDQLIRDFKKKEDTKHV